MRRLVCIALLLAGCAGPAQLDQQPRGAPPATASTVTITDTTVHAKPYDITPGLDPDLVMTRPAPQDWSPDADRPLDEQLPQPWSDKYLDLFDQAFNPSGYKTNASLMCAHVRANPEDADVVRPIAEDLFDRMLEHTVTQGDARFVVYTFDKGYKGQEVQAPWVSGLGNGSVIAGTLALDECWPDDVYTDTAYELANAYTVLPHGGDLWFSFVTDDHFLWFEEMPLPDPPMVLNGHITAITSLYYLWDRDRDNDQLAALLRAGITAAREYAPIYRRPGQVNCYDLIEPCHDDYGPERAVRQQHVLYRLSGDESFRQLRDQFADDMDVDWRQFD